MQPTSFRARDILPALIALARSALPDVRIEDGPWAVKPSENDVLNIGWAPGEGEHITAERVDGDLDGRWTENGDIVCYIATRTGNTDMAEVRDRAVTILETLEAALRADQTRLNGTVDTVDIGAVMSLTQYKTQTDGAQTGLPFSVRYTAYI